MGDIVVEASSGNTGGTSYVASLPATHISPSAGDLVVLVVANHAATVSPSGYSGWTLYGGAYYSYNIAFPRLNVFYKVATGSEGTGSVGISYNGATYFSWAILNLSNQSPVATALSAYSSSSGSTSPDPPASVDFSSSSSDGIVIAAAVGDGNVQSFSAVPSGYTEVYSGTAGPSTPGNTGLSFSCAYKLITNALNDNPGAFTLSGSVSWAALSWSFEGSSPYSISMTLKDSSGTTLPDGVGVILIDASEIAALATGNNDGVYVHDASTLSNGDGTYSATIYTGTDKVLIVDPNDAGSIDGETMITPPITPTAL